MTTRSRLCTLAIALLVIACGGDSDGSAKAEAATSHPDAPPPVMGSFQLSDTSFAFRVTKCDLTGTAPDGILVLGTGTMPDGSSLLPDGRMMLIEVERLTPHMGGPASAYERATVRFGGFMDKDGWEATAASWDGSRWATDDMMMSLDGPIIEVSGNELVVAATYKHASRDERVGGTLRVTCPEKSYGTRSRPIGR